MKSLSCLFGTLTLYSFDQHLYRHTLCNSGFLDFTKLAVATVLLVSFSMHLLLVLFTTLCSGISALPSLPNLFRGTGLHHRQSTCPGNLPPLPEFEFPHMIMPISASNPDTSYPNTLTPNISVGDVSAVFNFDIPQARQGQMCTWQFLFPMQDQLTTSRFKLIGFGTFSFSLSMLGVGAVPGMTTYNNQPLQSNPHGFPCSVSMQPGSSYTLGSTICVPGLISVTMSSSDSQLEWFQDYNPCPIGLYMTYSP